MVGYYLMAKKSFKQKNKYRVITYQRYYENTLKIYPSMTLKQAYCKYFKKLNHKSPLTTKIVDNNGDQILISPILKYLFTKL